MLPCVMMFMRRWTIDALARKFRVRKQRVLAILALKVRQLSLEWVCLLMPCLIHQLYMMRLWTQCRTSRDCCHTDCLSAWCPNPMRAW